MTLLATFKHISSKNADYGAAEAYLTFEHDEFTMKPTLDENGRLIPREDYRISSLNCGGEDFAVACMRANLRYEKNQKREDVKSHHYIISFDPRDAADNGLTVDRAQEATVNAEKFMNVVRRHTSFEELTPTLLREFVEKIVVHECSYDENKTRRQDIEIYYSFVGKVDLPE